MITLTDNAVLELKALLLEKQAPVESGLRLGVQRGGCAGLQYTMQVAAKTEGDEVVEQDEVRVFLAQDSLEHLKGCMIDYSSDLSDAGFKIINPNAARSCGCGTSFEAKEEGVESSYDPALDGENCS
ncbi:MAG TPA: iron-sulfur cluster assembly accessory protein [Verrucomicrobiales bacterium]|nr:iron-sulfur cluster assembly accessory protein [Roseibacillus sp.]HCQ32831.1 iron-sulfur cluster assembly accessory protein [Verrucomicrobiales bacterium]|tara:strand:- start:1866 stop:2246 length:381 start_codon:yes stop_codon:yes gene_type:complete